MANLKTKKTAAGAQQYSSKGGAVKFAKSVNKDIDRYIAGTISKAEFKEKYGVSVKKAQNIVYAAAAVAKGDASESQSSKDVYSRYEKELKKEKTNDMSYGGMAKKKTGYNKGGYVNCGASVPGTQKK
tara:strand:- start:124 stop:507 length:384 start_codon:yes stop_codon:yes gene_type:complete